MSVRYPKYRLHKASGRALVELGGRRFYLGKYQSDASYAEYDRLIAEWLRRGKSVQPTSSSSPSISVNELILAYWAFASTYYVRDGQPTKELRGVAEALQPLKQLYGLTSSAEFGPRALKNVRQQMIESGLCRRVINQRIGRIKRIFKWAVAEELVPPSVYHGLQAVTGLRFGRSEARESEPVKPVPDLHVALVLAYVTPQVGAMIWLQRLTCMRPGEVILMRACDIDTSRDVWLYEPEQHKGKWRGHSRTVPLGPAAQQVLRPFLARAPNDYLFSPREADAWRFENQPPYAGRQRTTKAYPSELRRRERLKTNRQRKPKHKSREHYDVASYGRAITYGIERAERDGIIIPSWHPHRLRHSRATEIRSAHGIEFAQCVLGHNSVAATAIYAERDRDVAVRIARQSG